MDVMKISFSPRSAESWALDDENEILTQESCIWSSVLVAIPVIFAAVFALLVTLVAAFVSEAAATLFRDTGGVSQLGPPPAGNAGNAGNAENAADLDANE